MNNKMYAKQEMFKEPILYVDLNEQVDDDLDERNFSDDLYAYGIVEKNNSGAFTHVSWLVRTENIKHLSERGEYNEKK